MKTIVVTGSNGLLGQKLVYKLRNRADVKLIATAKGANRVREQEGYIYESMNITDEVEVFNVVKKYNPDTIINTAAMTNVDPCETERELCWKMNVDSVKILVSACNKFNCHLVHLSTDFIFDGEKGGLYNEEDIPNPLSYYGHSKLEAEKVVQSGNIKWAIIRTILVYGIVDDMSRSNIVLWAKGALESGKKLNVVDDQYRAPTLAEDLAQGCILAALKEAEGIFNISGKDYMSILEIVQRVADVYNLDKSLINVVSSSTLSQPAKRPPRTGFDLTKSRKILGYEPHTFEEGIAILTQQIK